ncbi:hypothetical protein VCHENC02_5217A, partial [Vibrio harveyi]
MENFRNLIKDFMED